MMAEKGEVFLSPLTQRGEFEQILKKDPFLIHDLVSLEVISFEPSQFQSSFSPFIREPEKREIELVPYQTQWEELFQKEAQALSDVLGDELTTLHHIGSTAIPGIFAKPIIDMLPVVKKIEAIDQLTPSLEALGYEAYGEFGMLGRRFFVKLKNGKRIFHVHIFQEGHPDIERHVRFRDYLRSHESEAQAYSELKKELVKKSPDDIEKYCWGKEDFVKAIEIKSFLWRTLEKNELS